MRLVASSLQNRVNSMTARMTKTRLWPASRWRMTLYRRGGTDLGEGERLAQRSGSWGMRGVIVGSRAPETGQNGRGNRPQLL